MLRRAVWAGVVVSLLGAGARGDIVMRNDGHFAEGKVVSQDEREIVFIEDQFDASATQHMPRSSLARLVKTDEHGALVADFLGPATQPGGAIVLAADPEAPPIAAAAKGPTYYVIPLHGAVGETVLASVLEKSLADALKRQPTVVVLDIDSPGGLVDEAKQIITVLHKYNKKLRIVALTNQDLSAAAILTLSVKTIYVKSSSTIGAATSYVSTNMTMSGKLEEKMQSAWRAVARNSAEEGGHEPMLADAMIDNDQELHWETVNGKPVVKEGKGDHMICRQGKVLTLSSHEAVDCGLASGEADDLDELGAALGLDKWTEMKGLGALLADALPKRVEAYNREMERIRARLMEHLSAAVKADPSQSLTTVTRIVTVPTGPGVPTGPQRYNPAMPGNPWMPGVVRPGVVRPGNPGYPGNPGMPAQPTQIVTQTQARSPAAWKGDSVTCVLALQQMEGDLKEAMAVSTAYGRASETEMLKDLSDKLGIIRATVWDDRNKYVHNAMPAGALRTVEVGGNAPTGYITTGHNGAPVLGFRYSFFDVGTKMVLAKLEPLCAKPATDAPKDTFEIMAKEGYAVGGLTVDSDGSHVVAVKVIFMGYKDGAVVKTDTYTSEWLGEPDDNKPKTLAGNGETVLGTCGRTAGNLTAIGLIVKPLEEKK